MGLCLSVSVCLCLSQVGVLLKRLNIYRANIASRSRNDGKTTSSDGESVGSGALPDCLDFRFCARMAAMSIPGPAFMFTVMLCNLDSIHRANITSYSNKKLSYRRRTARRNYETVR